MGSTVHGHALGRSGAAVKGGSRGEDLREGEALARQLTAFVLEDVPTHNQSIYTAPR